MLETFVFNELAKQAAVIDEALGLAHFRDRSGIEVEIVVERADGTVVAVEVKSAVRSMANPAPGHDPSVGRSRLGAADWRYQR